VEGTTAASLRHPRREGIRAGTRLLKSHRLATLLRRERRQQTRNRETLKTVGLADR